MRASAAARELACMRTRVSAQASMRASTGARVRASAIVHNWVFALVRACLHPRACAQLHAPVLACLCSHVVFVSSFVWLLVCA
eukprot:5251447-Alexandrium_andersonii.AAC.1